MSRIILAGDTSTACNTVAICRVLEPQPPLTSEGEVQPAVSLGEKSLHSQGSVQVIAEASVESPRLHSERLLSAVEWVLAEAGLGIEAVDLLAISIGPGSFTGLRIGASTWKGLAYAAGKPLVAVPTLDALSRLAAAFEGTVVAAIDARMQEAYGAVFRYTAGTCTKLAEDRVAPLAEIMSGLTGPVYCVGDAFNVYREAARAAVPQAIFAPPYLNAPRASAVAAEAVAMLAAGAPSDAALVSPVYLRASQAEENLAKKKAAVS